MYGLPTASRLAKALGPSLEVIQRVEAPVLDLGPGWEAVYQAKTSSKKRNLHRRRRRQLAELGRLEVVVARDLDELEPALEDAFRLHDLRWDGRPDGSGFATPAGRTFQREAIAALAELDVPRIVLLKLDGRAVAFHYYFAFEGRMYVHRLAFDPALARFSPGLVNTLDTIEAAADEGLTRVEFLGGAERYKTELADGFEPLCHGLGLAHGLPRTRRRGGSARRHPPPSPPEALVRHFTACTWTGSRPSRRLATALAGRAPSMRPLLSASQGLPDPIGREPGPGDEAAIGPNRCSAAKPTKRSPGSVERNQRSSSGHPSSTATCVRMLSREEAQALEGEAESCRQDHGIRVAHGPVAQAQPDVAVLVDPDDRDALGHVDAALDLLPQPRRATGPKDAGTYLATRAGRKRREDIRVKGEPVQRRRPVAHHRIGEPVEALPHAAARSVRLAIGEPPQARANDELDVGAGAHGERRALQSSLAPADDDHAPAAIAARSPGERWRTSRGLRRPLRAAEARRRTAPRRLRRRPRARRARPPQRWSTDSRRGPLEGCHIRRVALGYERLPEPLGVAQELLERNRLLTLLAHDPRPAVDRAEVAGRGQRGLLPVRAQEHVRRHPRAPRLHRLSECPGPSPGQVRCDREPVGARPDDRDVEPLRQSDRRPARPRVEAP